MEILKDVLKPGLKVVFCGAAAGDRSAQLGAYYAGHGIQFWGVLYEIELTPRQLELYEFGPLPNYGIGLTDLAKSRHGADSVLRSSDFDRDCLRRKIEQYAPVPLAFNGKRAAREFYSHAVDYGRQPALIGQTVVFVLPSTSGAGRRFWNKSYWRKLARFVKAQ